jgi:hypothetical protein
VFRINNRPAIGLLGFDAIAIIVSAFAAVLLKKIWNLWKALTGN